MRKEFVDFENIDIQKIPIPNDLDQKIKERLAFLQERRPSSILSKNKSILITAATFTLIITSGLASMEYFEFKNAQDKTTFELFVDQSTVEARLKEDHIYNHKVAKIRNELLPGKAVIFYEDSGMKNGVTIQKPFIISEFKLLNEKLNGYLDIPDVISDSYKFKNASINYRVYEDQENQKNITLQDGSVLKELALSNHLQEVTLTYADGFNHELTLNAQIIGQGGEDTIRKDGDLANLKVNGRNAVYDVSDNSGEKTLIWSAPIQGTNSIVVYFLKTKSALTTKKELVQMAEELSRN